MKNKFRQATVTFDDSKITCQIIHSKKAKYLRLQIRNGGELEVVLPRGLQLSDAERFLHKKSEWIKKHISKRKARENKFYLFGQEINISQDFDLFLQRHRISFKNNHLKITSPYGAQEKIEYLFECWLRKHAKKSLVERVQKLADRFSFELRKISIRGQRTRWGSCSSSGNLSFNYNLLRFRKEVIDYVIIHELCHLKEMNHSEKFWKLVESFCPDFRALKKELRSIPLL